MLVIPAIDLQQGKCVRLQQGNFNRVSVYKDSPIKLAQHYAKQGAQRLHLVDLDGAKSGDIQQLALIRMLKIPGLTLQVGGGIRTLASAQACFNAGVNKLVIGSIAHSNPHLVSQIIKEIGAENIVLALDVNIEDGVPRPAIHGWQTSTNNNLWEVVSYYQLLGIKDVLCTDIARDGMMNGPNFTLYAQAVERFPEVHWQASGGIRNIADLKVLASLKLKAAILGRMLYETDFDLANYLSGLTHYVS
ncbi:phosphoribosylformimino-5-aminoimidazole carboxamide ribotide isomerase [Legionella lansingensis]|uniref:1-(5-phosphoribosyl)-5-[(5-phosphoribosylamino)methylideneamino] imidazole-4-carboxamide isomerase n=1 Tax=Legionella lansingensis TaxID=45067 RepID=A0A0W0VGU4_9GAMM|nr:1-(5-phosphoribosyl)-5-[(5-phosphoribosylamino)methylideneamino]imidazole-4-carboxamide isomerase [Legionella lansingensis]KTD19329.1 phosphoribosylformimino-5-aminoimidazole carboxamide ribotide isomerase [Legionella lansingensis]SNV50382.1 phosphoribosylformimino-5-aminoimidazole carboxamide ribotide isomerase [Legionella lansingensis]